MDRIIAPAGAAADDPYADHDGAGFRVGGRSGEGVA
jgi:hypothetical protein